MKKLYTIVALYAIVSVYTISFAAGEEVYGKILYRVNAGGWYINSIDTSTKGWIQDDAYGACPYVDTTIVGDKTFGVYDAITLDASVPSSTPTDLFKTERDLNKTTTNLLQYKFPIKQGQKVEVRLYFSENYYSAPGQRLMNVYVEGTQQISNFDIFTEVGKNVGIMKKYVITINDGNLEVAIGRVKNYAMINGIEIIEINDATVQGIFAGNYRTPKISVFPNPFISEIKIDNAKSEVESINMYDAFGKEISVYYDKAATDILINMERNPKGIYYLKVFKKENSTETIKLIKD